MQSPRYASIACNLDTNILLAALPLFEAEQVQAIEWSFDALFQSPEIPPWFLELLQAFSKENRLIGHGVFFSLFSGKWANEQQIWLDQLKKLTQTFQFDHITEHFGFMTGENFHQGAPISIPFTPSTLAIGQDRLKRIYDAGQCPIGLENLAFAYSLDEVKIHGAFLEQLLIPINGFIILDLHNLYCQLHNFDLPFETIIDCYPLERVREIHISGGSWEEDVFEKGQQIRRDTHDEAVPDKVFDLLEQTLTKCPNLKFVVLEQLGTGLKTEESRVAFRKDFERMNQIVQAKEFSSAKYVSNHFLPKEKVTFEMPLEDKLLYAQQLELSHILETSANYRETQRLLHQSSLANSAWAIENWQPSMVETVRKIAQKWKHGFNKKEA